MTEFEQLYERYFRDVYRYILRLSGSEQIAEEITSDTFFKAMQAIDRFRGDCDVRVWLCQIAKNSYFSFIRQRNRIAPLDAVQDTPDPAPDAAEACIRRDTLAQIHVILHGVGEPYREVFMWRVYAELSFRQIAQIFGKTENWACVTYHRARKMIKERLEEANRET